MPTRWLTGTLQKIWLTPLLTPLTVGGSTFRLAPLSHVGSLCRRCSKRFHLEKLLKHIFGQEVVTC